MNIVFLLSSLGAGGAERVAATLCSEWRAIGHDVTLVATYSGGGQVPFYEVDGVSVISLANRVRATGRTTLLGYLRRLMALRLLIKECNADLVISFLPNVNVAGILATLGSGIPVVVSERSDPRSRKLSLAWRLSCRLLYRFADAVVVQTTDLANALPSIYPGVARVEAIPNPLPRDLRHFSVVGAREGRRTLLSIGRLIPEKQIDHILRAFAGLSDEYPDWDLLIVGEGPAEPLLKQLTLDLGLQERVRFAGVTKFPWKVMASCDVFLMTSCNEGFPNSLVEAMAIGLPCIAYDCPSGPAEITRNGEDGLLISLNDEPALSDSIRKLMGDMQLRNKTGMQAAASVQQRYHVDVVLDKWSALFARLTRGAK